MKDILSELFYGNISPSGKSFKRGSEYHNALMDVTKYEEELLASLHGEEKELFEKYSDAQGKLLTITACRYWKQGFSLGLKAGMEVIETVDELAG